jgi:hypothetical protein
MLWSGLFDRWSIKEATSIWWMNDVEGGGLRYWPDGPDRPPRTQVGDMANSALVGDNHGMFHQVEPVGPFGSGTHRVSSRAELAPVGDGSGDWVVTDRGKESYRAPLNTFRVSILWKADVYLDEKEQRRLDAEDLTLDKVARVFDADLATKGADFRFDLERLEDPGLSKALSGVYPESVPIGAGRSVFDSYS